MCESTLQTMPFLNYAKRTSHTPKCTSFTYGVPVIQRSFRLRMRGSRKDVGFDLWQLKNACTLVNRTFQPVTENNIGPRRH